MHEPFRRHSGRGGGDRKGLRSGRALGYTGGEPKQASQVLLQQVHPGIYDAKDTGRADQGVGSAASL